MMPATMNRSAMTPRTTADAVRPEELPDPVEGLTCPPLCYFTLPPRWVRRALWCCEGICSGKSTADVERRVSEGSHSLHIHQDVLVLRGVRDRRCAWQHCPRKRSAGRHPPA